MSTRKLLYMISAILILGVLATSMNAAVFNTRRIDYVTFDGPFRLPGLTLGAGTYTFELPIDSALDYVRVSSRDGKHVYFGAFTKVIDRPRGIPPYQSIIFGENPHHSPATIKAWFPQDDSTGRQFIY